MDPHANDAQSNAPAAGTIPNVARMFPALRYFTATSMAESVREAGARSNDRCAAQR